MNHPSTPPTLLSRVRNPADHEAWREFDDRYRQLLIRFCQRQGVPFVESEDLVQRIFIKLSQTLPKFAYDPVRGRFRDYLYRSARNAISDWGGRPIHASGAVDTCDEVMSAAIEPGPETQAWEEEWVAHHYRLALRTVRQTFEPRSIEVFERMVAGESIGDLAREYTVSEASLQKVRQRIRDRMKELIADQVREEDEVDDPATPS